jgi:hypothetical protein
MISSEVQRTLVKSAPELWSELSDEAALARHLSEFAHVRIAQMQPEERIDWVADGARGSILIKPSGWGTRVTLTLQRERVSTSAGAARPQPATPDGAARPVTPGSFAQSATPDVVPAQPKTAAPPAPGRAAPPAAPPRESPTPQPPESGRPEPGVPESPAPAPDSPAQEPAAAKPRAAQPQASDSPAPETTTPDRDAPAVNTALEPASPAAQDTAASQREVIPRRGLFARVVSSWQRALAWAERPSEARPVTPDPAAAETPAAAGASNDGTDRPAAPTPESSSMAGAAERPGTTAATDGVPASPLDEPSPSASTQPRPSDRGTSQLPIPSLPHPDHASPPQDSPAPKPSAAADAARTSEPRPVAGGEKDLSAELRAAEEAPDEGDAAVLRAVLDSLGSAHHRPFSRA